MKTYCQECGLPMEGERGYNIAGKLICTDDTCLREKLTDLPYILNPEDIEEHILLRKIIYYKQTEFKEYISKTASKLKNNQKN